MKTEVVMKRELFGMEISQKSKSEFFSATDLVMAGNNWRRANGKPDFSLREYFRRKSTKAFVAELEEYSGSRVKINSTGHNSHTWVHPFLFIDIALAISPKLKIETYQWLFDKLLAYRNDSGDSYRRMAGALYDVASRKDKFPENIAKVAKLIQVEVGVTDWQSASEEELRYRDKIQDSIALLADVLKDGSQAVKLGIEKAKRTRKGVE